MADNNLQVDPVDLHVAARAIDDHARDLQSAHRTSEAQAEAAGGQWVGQSAAALHALVPQWREFSASINSRLADHAARFTGAANVYTTTDGQNANSIKGVVTPPNLNLAD